MRRERPSPEHLSALVSYGLSLGEMAVRTGGSVPTLRGWLREAGITRRRRGKRIGAWGDGAKGALPRLGERP